MVDSFRELLRQRLAQGAYTNVGGPIPRPPVPDPSRLYPGGAAQAYALARPGQADPMRISDPAAGNWAAKYEAAQKAAALRLAARLAMMKAGGGVPQSVATPSAGQMAYDQQRRRIQDAPSVGQPTPDMLPQEPNVNRMRGGPGMNQVPDAGPAFPNLDAATQAIQAMPGDSFSDAGKAVLDKGTEVIVDLAALTDWARDKSVSQTGDAAYNVATGEAHEWDPGWAAIAPANWMIPGVDSTRFNQDFEAWAENPKNWETIRSAHEDGYNGFTGGRAVWEAFIEQAPRSYRIVADLLNDPTIVLPGGQSFGKTLDVMGTANAARGNSLTALAQKGTGQVLQAPQAVLDKTIDAPFNAIGSLLAKGAGQIPGVRQLVEETPQRRAVDLAEQADEDIRAYDLAATKYGRTERELPEDATPRTRPGDPIPETPTSGPKLYTVVFNGKEAVILRPDGSVMEKRILPKVNTYNKNQVRREVEQLNLPLRRDDAVAKGMSVPTEDLGYLDPYARSYDGSPTAAPDTTWFGREVADMSADPNFKPATDAFTEEYYNSGVARAYKDVLDQLEKDFPGASNGVAEKALARVINYGEDVIPIWRNTIKAQIGFDEAPYIFKYGKDLDPGVRTGSVANIGNVIEHAVFGTDADATAARKWLRSRSMMIGDETSQAVGDRLSKLRASIYGEGSLSQADSAVKSRKYRAKPKAAIDEAGVAEVTNTPTQSSLAMPQAAPTPAAATPTTPATPFHVWQRNILDEIAGRSSTKKELAAKGERIPNHLKGYQGPYEGVIKKALQTAKTWKDVEDDINAYATKLYGERDAVVRGSRRRNKAGNLSEPGREVYEATREGRGWKTADAIKQALYDNYAEISDSMSRPLGIVPPGVALNIELGDQSNRAILERAGAIEGPGAASVADDTPIGQAFADGEIDQATYQRLNAPVLFNGREMPMYQAYDELVVNMRGDIEGARSVLRGIVNPKSTAGETKKINKLLEGYDNTLMTLREQMQFNVATGARGAIADQTGNAYTLLITGYAEEAARMWNPKSWIRFFMDERGNKAAIDNLPGMDMMRRTGQEPPESVMQLSVGRFEAGGSEMTLRSGMKKIGLDGKLSGAAYGALANQTIRDFRIAMDRNARYVLFVGEYARNIAESRARFMGMARERAAQLGENGDDWVRRVDDLGEYFNNQDVLDAFGDQRLARDWRELTAKAKLDAKKETERIFFSYKQTGADAVLRRIAFFHYWTSRAFVLHTKTALQNPWLLSAYARTYEAMKDEAEENGYPSSLTGYIRLMGDTSSGFYGLVNPINVLVPFSMLVESGTDESGVIPFLKRWGLFINPIIDGAAMAVGQSSGPIQDLTQTRQVRNAIRATVNYLNNNGYGAVVPDALGEDGTLSQSWLDQAQYQFMNWLNGRLQAVDLPFAEEFKGNHPQGYEDDQINNLIIEKAERQYGPIALWDEQTWDIVTEAMRAVLTGEQGNPLTDEALQDYTKVKMGQTIANSVVPGGINVRYGPRDEVMQARKEGDDSAALKMDLAQSGSPEDVQLTALDAQYKAIGTDRQRQAHDSWTAIAYDDVPPGMILQVGGQSIRSEDLMKMTRDQRIELADQWIAQYDATGDLAKYQADRKAFIEKHPEYGDYDEYRKAVYNEDNGGPRKFRNDLARTKQGSGFKAAMDRERADLIKYQGLSGEPLEESLDHWAANLDGYQAAIGVRGSAYDPPPGEARLPSDVTPIGDATSGGAKAKTTPLNPMEKVRKNITDYVAEAEVAKAKLRAMGYSDNLEELQANPYYAPFLSQFNIPELKGDAKLYYDWLAFNPGKSVDDFIRYLEELAARQPAA